MKHEYDANEEDERHDAEVVREMDDRTDMAVRLAAAKRAAAGVSAEQLSIQDAYAEGARAGVRGVSSSLNPYQDNSPEHDAWSRGRLAAIGRELSRRSA